MNNCNEKGCGALVESIYRCACNGNVVTAGTKNGYPAFRCLSCGMEWWTTTCWKNFRHLIDGRTAKRCRCCGYYHCSVCQACQPDRGCKCDGNC